ncbi:HD-GYP domain-containing protein [Brevibacillus invocatus]|uniref:HD-GYP domain-containing protein n=1 Tax=Brevibacillus invocatus TaxID=173959 RepID=UPI00203F7A27|nr:HD-GYP domain-containing protein [Brevibacillus invocatus]MCM3079679.1 HD-GYP domain-containing protein [Brevibacillus invocatus]MCM3431111.1 HD-GYP domain-containing protein [Brevibacillus invocatus]
MIEVKPSRSIIGKTVAKDIYNEYGLLLLPAGVVLHKSDIRLLRSHQISAVFVAESEKIAESLLPAPLLIQGGSEGARQYVLAMKRMEHLFEQVAQGSVPSLHQFHHAFSPLLEHVLPRWSFLRFVYQFGGTQNYLARHSLHVGMLSALIGKLLGKSDEEVVMLGHAGLLHDIGKLQISGELLTKPGKLEPFEYEAVKQHSLLGAHLIRQMEGADETIALCALMHHERLDGSGYPQRLTKEAIPLECQIVSVADFFDAMCTDRVYRVGTSPFEAANILWEQACALKLQASIVSLFIHYIAQLYVGTEGVLNNGDTVEIVMVHKDEPTRPLVRRGEEFLDLRQYRSLRIMQMIG